METDWTIMFPRASSVNREKAWMFGLLIRRYYLNVLQTDFPVSQKKTAHRSAPLG
jgi:hypothetical protein